VFAKQCVIHHTPFPDSGRRVDLVRERIPSYADFPLGRPCRRLPPGPASRRQRNHHVCYDPRGPRPARRARLRGATRSRAANDRNEAVIQTSEFIAYVAVLTGIFIAGAVTKAGAHGNDVFRWQR